MPGDMPEVSAHESCDGGPLFGDDATAAVQTRYHDASSFLRELLEANGYTAHTAIERTGVISAAGGPPGGDEFFDMRHRGDLAAELSRDAQGNLLLLFLVGRALDEATCEATFGGATLAQLLDFGLLLRTHVNARVLVHSAVQIYPLALRSRELMLATDWDLDGTDSSRDRRYAVMPIGLDSLQLALSLPPSLTGMRVLDVCSGSGIQALTAAAHGAADVLATDISARALRFVCFNTALNALDDVVRVAEGSCYQPARGEVFDVILANPPFVAVPPTEVEAVRPALYVSGGADGADVVRELVCGAVAAREGAVSGILAPGGCLLLVAQLPEIDAAHVWLLGAIRAGEAQRSAQRSAVEIAIVYDPRHTQSAEQYAAARAADYGCSARDWAASMRAAGARTMGFGVVIVRVGDRHHERGHRIRDDGHDDDRHHERGHRIRVPQVAEADASTATMLYGDGLQLVRGCVERALFGEAPIPPQHVVQEEGGVLGRIRGRGPAARVRIDVGNDGFTSYRVGSQGVLVRPAAANATGLVPMS